MATSIKIADIKCTDLLNLEKKGAIDPFVIVEYLGKILYLIIFDFQISRKTHILVLRGAECSFAYFFISVSSWNTRVNDTTVSPVNQL